MKLIKTISLFLILLFLFPNPSFSKSSTTSSINQYLSGLSQNQKLTIDNFSTVGRNKIGAESTLTSPENTHLRKTYRDEDAIYKQGRSLEVIFGLLGKNQFQWKTQLEPLDISQAKNISFWYQGTFGVKESLRVRLVDINNNQKEIAISPYVGQKEKNKWKPVLIPLEKFEGVDLNYLKELQINLHSGFLGMVGQVIIDQVEFSGPADLSFASLKDNLKGFPKQISNLQRRKSLLKLDSRLMLKQIAKDTWKYFDNFVDSRNELIVDHVKLDTNRFLGDYTSPTNIGLYHISCIGAYHLGFIPRAEALRRIQRSFATIQKLKKHKNFLYNYYNTTHMHPTSSFISSIDNAWLAVSYVVIRSAFKKELGGQASSFLNQMDFDFFYDPGVGQMSIGYDEAKKAYSSFHYSLLSTETRMLSMLAIGKGDVPKEHWFHLYRIPPTKWDWQTQKGKEKAESFGGFDVRTGFYKYKQRRFIPSWGGSMFEFLMPTIIVSEKKWAPLGLGLNNKIASEIQRDYALKERKYPVWGISPCSYSRGKETHYGEFGIKALGVKGYNDAGIVTPHATFLALETIPEDAIENIKQMIRRYDVYGEYGFYDALQARGRTITRQYLALDQGMSFIALVNYLNNGSIQQLFGRDPIGRKVQALLKDEEFF